MTYKELHGHLFCHSGCCEQSLLIGCCCGADHQSLSFFIEGQTTFNSEFNDFFLPFFLNKTLRSRRGASTQPISYLFFTDSLYLDINSFRVFLSMLLH